jgi:hypothetical protein
LNQDYAATLAASAIALGALTVADDADFFGRIKKERNLPELIKQDLPSLY